MNPSHSVVLGRLDTVPIGAQDNVISSAISAVRPMSAVTLKTQIQAVIRDMGWHDGALYLLSRALEVISRHHFALRKYYFVSQPVGDDPLLPPRRGSQFRLQWIDQNHPLVAAF